MDFQDELRLLIKARYPILYIVTIEEDRLEYTIRRSIRGKNPKNLYIWDFIEGYELNPLEALEFIEKITSRTPSFIFSKIFSGF